MRLVFQGRSASICTECINEIQHELWDKDIANLDKDLRHVIRSRVKKSIQELSPYSIPLDECPVKLDGNESPFSLPEDILNKVQEQIKDVPINRYPDPDATTLRNKISNFTSFPLEGILLGNGSDELIEMVLITFSGGTKRILFPVPTFSMFKIITVALDLEPLEVELDQGFDIEIEETLKILKDKNPDLIFLASPNNPTGNCFSEEKIVEIIINSSGIVVVDEAYGDFSGKTFLNLIDKHENLIILRTMSKVGFAGLRLGILFGNSRLVNEINKVRLPFNINSLSQGIAKVVLDNISFVRENVQLIIRERGRVYNSIKNFGDLEAFRSDANFILFKVDDADKVFKGLIDKGVLIRNFNSPGRLENCLRVTIGKPEENEAFIDGLREIISS